MKFTTTKHPLHPHRRRAWKTSHYRDESVRLPVIARHKWRTIKVSNGHVVDNFGRLKTVKSDGQTTTYEYYRLLKEEFDGDNNGTFEKQTYYGYDHTQQTSKSVSENGILISETTFEYDAQGRMSVVTIITENRKEVTKYEYGADGIRTSAEHKVWEDGELTKHTKTEYLNDPLNITGYSQVLKQTETDVVTSKETVTTYVIGHQRISQTVKSEAENVIHYFTFDGHGSTRVLLNAACAVAQLYSFDAYVNALGFNPSKALTEFLYSGEQFDSKIGQQYLRARYYDPTTGRFNRLDPFFGNAIDPQSFHKYLYTHGDPVNGIDPSGLFLFGDSQFGYMVEKEIEIQHRREFPHNVLYGKWVKLGPKPQPTVVYDSPLLYRAKPDILNMDLKTYNEIKPLSPSGIIAGIAQMALRVTHFSGTGYVPDIKWFPPEQPLFVGTQLISVINIGGVLFYTDMELNIQEALVYTSIDVAWTTYAISGAQYSVMNALPRALTMADTARKIDAARLEGHCPIGAFTATAASVVVSFSISFGF